MKKTFKSILANIINLFGMVKFTESMQKEEKQINDILIVNDMPVLNTVSIGASVDVFHQFISFFFYFRKY